MKITLISENDRFYKVNMHCHTNISDGSRTPEEVKEFYKNAGYSAVCFTDHEILMNHKKLCDKDFIALNGYEVAIKESEDHHTGNFKKAYHFNIVAPSQDDVTAVNYYINCRSCPGNAKKYIDEFAKYSSTIDHTEYDIDWINNFLQGIADAGFLICYNHPSWSLQDSRDYAPLKHLHAVEVINGACATSRWDNTSTAYETLLRMGERLVPVGGDDNHVPSESGLAWTMIRANELSYEALIDGYKRGDCYASEGPEIRSIVIENGKIKVKTSSAARITVLSQGRYTAIAGQRGKTITEAEFNYLPEKFGDFFRIEVRDPEGFCAFSTAYYTSDIEEQIKNQCKNA